MPEENEKNSPLGRLDEIESIAFTEKAGRHYVGVKGTDSRGRGGYVVCDFDTGELIYEHASWMVGAYLYEKSIHHEYEHRLAQLNRETSEFYFGENGVATVLRRNLHKKVSCGKAA